MMTSPPGTPEYDFPQGSSVTEEEALEYIEKHKLSGLFEDLLASVVYHRPKRLLEFLLHVVKERLHAERTGETVFGSLDLVKLKEVRSKQVARPLRLGHAAAELDMPTADVARKSGAVGGIRRSDSGRTDSPRTQEKIAQRTEAVKKQRVDKSEATPAELSASELEQLRNEVEIEREAELESRTAGRRSPRPAMEDAVSGDAERARLQSRAKSRGTSRPSTVAHDEHERKTSLAERDRDLADPDGMEVGEPSGPQDAEGDFGTYQSRDDRRSAKKPATSPRSDGSSRGPPQRTAPPAVMYKLPEGFIEKAHAEAARAEAAKAAAKKASAEAASAPRSVPPPAASDVRPDSPVDSEASDDYVNYRPVSRVEQRQADSSVPSDAESSVPARFLSSAQRRVRPPTFIEAEQAPRRNGSAEAAQAAAPRKSASESYKAKMEFFGDVEEEASDDAVSIDTDLDLEDEFGQRTRRDPVEEPRPVSSRPESRAVPSRPGTQSRARPRSAAVKRPTSAEDEESGSKRKSLRPVEDDY
eukprot:TRINITY_DN18569_c0_g1_i1.p1 TRINITY_DN18569_c0_g1~~TRINITY_DN18569_c0_g1_i1.p1  ORF type:complete len:529 (-),score=135.37 TRINITY_DN18569_c0_g1_i1:252-1838(-)